VFDRFPNLSGFLSAFETRGDLELPKVNLDSSDVEISSDCDLIAL
jgi:hypothetical protein